MPHDLSLLLTPLLLLPGVALLIASTSTRYGQLHGELHHLAGEGTARAAERARGLLVRARLFRSALVSLYVAVALLAVASLLGGVLHLWARDVIGVFLALTCLAVVAVAFAAAQMIRESSLSLRILCAHVDDVAEIDRGRDETRSKEKLC